MKVKKVEPIRDLYEIKALKETLSTGEKGKRIYSSFV